MATRAKPRKSSPRKHSNSPANEPGTTKRVALAVTGWFATIETPQRLQREVLAVIAIAGAALIALPLTGLDGGQSLLSMLGEFFRSTFGRGAFLLPVLCLWLAGESLFSENAGARRRRALGVAMLFVTVTGFLHLAGASTVENAGGYFGSGFGAFFRLIVGEIGAGIILFALGIVGVYFLTGADAISIFRELTRSRSRPAPEVAVPEQQRREPNAEVKKEKQAAERPAEPQPKPVIAIPESRRKKKPAKTAESEQAEPDGEKPSDLPAVLPLPKLTKLALYESGTPEPSELEEKARLIEETLANFKVSASVREIHPGPAVTLFTLKPGAGVKVRRITELQNDLALALAAPSIRIEAPVPGMARVGVEIPNQKIHTVGLRETVESTDFHDSKAKLPLSLGRDVNGHYRIADLTKMPHLLIAGATGSGKSVCINGILATFLAISRPDDVKLVMIDPKMVELTGFNGVPHLKCPVVTDMNKVVAALRKVLQEMEARYQRFSELGVRNIDGYNIKREDDATLPKLPYIIVVIDELADLMMTAPDEVESLLVRLAQMARATGIHLLIATQRPSVDVLTGLIKANVPARIAFAVTSQTDSRVVLDIPGAERLLGKGDMLYLPPDAAKPHRMQGSFIDDGDLEYLVNHWKSVCPDHEYEADWVNLPSSDESSSGNDDMMDLAREVVQEQGTASASMLQRRLRIGYNRAARLIEQMEDDGLVGPADGSRGRRVLVDGE